MQFYNIFSEKISFKLITLNPKWDIQVPILKEMETPNPGAIF